MGHSCIAHIHPETGAEQTAANHCRATAAFARKLLSSLGLGDTAYLAGLLHDMGKFTHRFEVYLRQSISGDPAAHRGSVNHTFAAVRFLLQRYHAPAYRSMEDVTCEVLSYAVGAHHGQFDCIGPDGSNGFLHRLTKEDICYEEALQNFLSQCADENELNQLFQTAVQEVSVFHSRLLKSASDETEGSFLYSLLCRLLLSALISADRCDTAAFFGVPLAPTFPENMSSFWERELHYMEEKLHQFPADTSINCSRRAISDQCRAFASRNGGIYRLSVPTGAGKTLSALRYALAHGATFCKKRIFFVIPLLSVIEQNSVVIREYLSNECPVLEHHSNILREEHPKEQLDPRELLMEDWSAPVVITTLVQLLNTLFLGKTSSIRRFHSLTESILIIDEVQSLPRQMLSQFNLALNFLSEACGVTVILCSATQPCLERLPHALHLSEPPDLVPYSATTWEAFRRTEIIDHRKTGGYSAGELASFVRSHLSQSLLLICNTKAQAFTLYQALQGGAYELYHLSTSMCTAHRMDTLHRINEALHEKRPVICVSTQLVEAGIDFSFAVVVRILAGMDNIAQAAGRCNRNGDFCRICPVYIVNFQGEDLRNLKEILASQQAAKELLDRFKQNSSSFDDDLLSDTAITYYYRQLFRNFKDKAPDYPLPDLSTTMIKLLSQNNDFCAFDPFRKNKRFWLNQAFATAGTHFQVFSNQTTDVLVPYREGNTIISALYSQRAKQDLAYCQELLTKAKPYTVSLYDHQLRRLGENGGLQNSGLFCAVLPDFYDDFIGIIPEAGENLFLEV